MKLKQKWRRSNDCRGILLGVGWGDEHPPSRENPVKGNPVFSNIPKSLPENPPNFPILCN